jgi:hypothetical protein
MIEVHPVIETILEKWRSKLGDDVDAYRGHAYRVLNIALELQPFDESTRDLVAIAIAYHDLGVWACDTMDYIHASAEIAADFAEANGLHEWAGEIRLIIEMHHKVTPYTGLYETTVETVRRADLYDLSYGWLPRDIERKGIRRYLENFPDCHFHRRIALRIAGHMVRHPFSPLPMMRW